MGLRKPRRRGCRRAKCAQNCKVRPCWRVYSCFRQPGAYGTLEGENGNSLGTQCLQRRGESFMNLGSLDEREGEDDPEQGVHRDAWTGQVGGERSCAASPRRSVLCCRKKKILAARAPPAHPINCASSDCQSSHLLQPVPVDRGQLASPLGQCCTRPSRLGVGSRRQ